MYDLKSIKMPIYSGWLLRLIARLLEGPLHGLLLPGLLKNAGISGFRKQDFDECPTFYPLHYRGELHRKDYSIPLTAWPENSSKQTSGGFNTISNYADSYAAEKTTVTETTGKVLQAIEKSDHRDLSLAAFIEVNPEDVRKQADASGKRIRDGKSLSILDGVPIAIKDEVDMTGYSTTAGRSFKSTIDATADATVVSRLRSAGALLIGKTNMHEIGIGVTGLNPHHGTVRNPYNPAHHSGGSSSGSAAAVAAGICPAAIGADGGGSIRIPSAFCGLVGLKSTFGRISEHGATPLDWSVAHLGPIAATVGDAALIWSAIAGPNLQDPQSLHQPLPTIAGWDNTDLSDLTLGIYPEWFNHADPEIVSVCETMMDHLVQKGASIREVVIPDLDAGRIAHLVTIASEMSQADDRYRHEHMRDYGLDVRINLALARAFTSRDYIKAQRVRTRMIGHFNKAFENVDVIMTPTTGIPAPPIDEKSLPQGNSDLSTLTEIMRFATYANLTGLPAITFPAGYSKSGLPIGIQGIGRAWEEVTLFRLALAGEQSIEKRMPEIHYGIIDSKV